MAGQQQQPRQHRRDDDEPEPSPPPAAPQSQGSGTTRDEGLDDLLDEIDGVLETNAQEFVHTFVQKGGQ